MLSSVSGLARNVTVIGWCPVCGTRHERPSDCPGELRPTGPERHGWRVTVETPIGIEAYGVLVVDCGGVWRARILTYPNVLWCAPRGEGALKFVGATAAEAEDQAVTFVLEHCHTRGFTVRNAAIGVPSAALPEDAAQAVPALRKVRFLPIRFGALKPSNVAKTGNLSETGLFILTPDPADPGSRLALTLTVGHEVYVDLAGRVVWRRKDHFVGRVPGMGIQLPGPPEEYLEYVRSLS
jgi:hypothetical protein